MASPGSPFFRIDFLDFSAQPAFFANPVAMISAHTLDQVRPALRALQDAADSGYYAAGSISYEAAPAFDQSLRVRRAAPDDRQPPLLSFGVFTDLGRIEPEIATHPDPHTSMSKLDWTPSITPSRYRTSVEAIRDDISAGNVYQANYTIRLRAEYCDDDYAWYVALRNSAKSGNCAYLNLGRYRILSLSPELFFRRKGTQIVTRPMKGTRPRGRWVDEDEKCAAELVLSEKDRAENVMIVDLLRNDLGKICVPGSIVTPALLEIETYPTVFQMTSTVSGTLNPATTVEDILTALFPCGSVTGAPKTSAMRIIAREEDSPRGPYCGAIGVLTPAGDAYFNVAIRTIVLDTMNGDALYGVGGGITWGSEPDAEYAEALSKAAVVTIEIAGPFEILETMKLADGVYYLRDRHIRRLWDSARYFGFPLEMRSVDQALDDHAALHGATGRRVRLLVDRRGSVRIESSELPSAPNGPMNVVLAATAISKTDPFLCHKTTNRSTYDRHRRENPSAFDVLLWNETGELTEFTVGNLVAEIDGTRWTPPRECGLLAGTLRDELVQSGEVRESVLMKSDLDRATRIWLVNSVRGQIEVTVG